jgi:hypothetical protein
MKKKVIAIVWCTVVVFPVLGILTEGGPTLLGALGFKEGGPTLLNVFSLLYFFFIVVVYFPAPQWVRNTINDIVNEDVEEVDE